MIAMIGYASDSAPGFDLTVLFTLYEHYFVFFTSFYYFILVMLFQFKPLLTPAGER